MVDFWLGDQAWPGTLCTQMTGNQCGLALPSSRDALHKLSIDGKSLTQNELQSQCDPLQVHCCRFHQSNAQRSTGTPSLWRY
jgi:hypothetical protein